MTNAELKKYLGNLARQTDLKTNDLNSHTGFCVRQGLRDFWSAYPWHCRCRSDDLTLTGLATNLPDDFAQFRSLRETDSIRGYKLVYLEKDEFDRKYPKPESYNTSNGPVVFTCYQDEGVWKVVVAPAVIKTLPLDYFRKPPADIAGLPDHLISGLVIAAGKYLWAPGTTAWWSASNAYRSELERLQVIDGPAGSMGSKFLDDTEQLEPGSVYPWAR